VLGEAFGLRVDAAGVVPGDDHVVGGFAPAGRLVAVGAEPGGLGGMSYDGVGGCAQVPLGEQVGVDVVVGDRAVLVGASDTVDPEPASLAVVVAERAPEPRGFDEQFEPGRASEVFVAGCGLVAGDGVGDVGVDVEGGGAGRPVA
jgi:hypothetical protein